MYTFQTHLHTWQRDELDNTFLEPAWDSVDHVSWNINPVHVQLMVF